jgi:hypothetical protein
MAAAGTLRNDGQDITTRAPVVTCPRFPRLTLPGDMAPVSLPRLAALPANAGEVIALQQEHRWSKPDHWRMAELVSGWTQGERDILEE